MGNKYLKTVLGFMGITDYTTIAGEMLDVIGQDVDALLSIEIQKAQDIAKNF